MTKKQIKINGKNIEYALRRRKGSRSVRLAVYPDGAFVVTAPKWYPVYIINRFLEEKAQWIWEKLKEVDFGALAERKKTDGKNYQEQKELARLIIAERIRFFNRNYNFAFQRVAIKNQKTCWGSCSRKGNLNFNYKIINLPEELRDYVVVHELCHLRELNHSHRFWELVAKVVPEYKMLRNKLKNVKMSFRA